MVAAGLVARNAAAKGLTAKPWVKTSLAPGSRVVTDYLEKSGLIDDLGAVGFLYCRLRLYDLHRKLRSVDAVDRRGRPERRHRRHQRAVPAIVISKAAFIALVKHNFLASPPLVVAYALAGNMEVDLFNDPLGHDQDGNPVFMKDIWPSQAEVQGVVQNNIDSEMFQNSYDSVFEGDANWKNIESPEGEIYTWDSDSTYVKNPPYFEGMSRDPAAVNRYSGCTRTRAAGRFRHHRSHFAGRFDRSRQPGGTIPDRPGRQAHRLQFLWLQARQSRGYDARHVSPTSACVTSSRPEPRVAGLVISQVASKCRSSTRLSAIVKRKTPLIVIAGSEYGTGSSRDWAAKGTILLGVKAVIAKSFERIHRSNLIGMGVLPLQFR